MTLVGRVAFAMLLVQLACAQVPSTLQKTLFYEDTSVSSRIFNQPLVDQTGNVIAIATQLNVGCPFGVCGAVVYSIAPDGTLNWKKPDTGFAANAVNQVAIGADRAIYFQGDAQLGQVFAWAPNGTPVPGWPVQIGFPLDIGPRTLVIDPVDGSVLMKGGTSFSFSSFPGRVAAHYPDSSLKWQADFANAPNNTPGMVTGPSNNVFTYSDQGIILDRNNGQQLCSYGQRFAALAGGADGVFTHDGAQILRINADCTMIPIFTSARGSVEVQEYDNGIVFAIDYPNNPFDGTQIRLLAVHSDGTLLWRSDAILPVGGISRISAISNGRLYVIGIDLADQKQKLFILNENTGVILDAFDTTGTCLSCGVAVAANGTVYLSDLQSTRLYVLSPVLGTINVTTNSPAATFTITDGGGASLSGTGTVFSQQAAPSIYTITYGAVSRFVTPTPQTAVLSSGGTVAFSGLYQPQAPILIVSTNTLDFADDTIGVPGQAQTLVASNIGGSDLRVSITVTGKFTERDNCNGIIVPGGSCLVIVIFEPDDEGLFKGTLFLTDVGAGISRAVELSGTGLLPQLAFPLHGISKGLEQHLTPETAIMNSVFDHTMLNPARANFITYACDGQVEDFKGELGVRSSPNPPCGSIEQRAYPQPKGTRLNVTQGYTGGTRLFYDGHPGYDYRSIFGNTVYSAASGVVHYPTLTELRDRDHLTLGGDPDDLHVLELQVSGNFKVFYLHLSTHPRSVSVNLEGSVNQVDFTAEANSDFKKDAAVVQGEKRGDLVISGAVTQGGGPLNGVAVQLAGITLENRCIYQVTQTDPGGQYSFEGLTKGYYNVRPIRKGLAFYAVHPNLLQPEGAHVDSDIPIGKSGNASGPRETGNAQTFRQCFLPHLHFEVQRAIGSLTKFPDLGLDLIFVPVDPYGWDPIEPSTSDPYFQAPELNGTRLTNKRLWK